LTDSARGSRGLGGRWLFRMKMSTIAFDSGSFESSTTSAAEFDSRVLVDSDHHLQGIRLTHPTTYTRAEYSIHDVFVDIYGPRYTPDTAPDEPYPDEIQQSHTSHLCDIAPKSRSLRSLRTGVGPSPLVSHPSTIRSHFLASCRFRDDPWCMG
jgi:hypothetical protein